MAAGCRNRSEANKRIYATTDPLKVVKVEADANGWDTFVVPDSVGGRFTVLTAVGLLPIAAAGADISKLMEGANAARKAYASISWLKWGHINMQLYTISCTVKVI